MTSLRDADIRFLYFDGCPNASSTLENLRSALGQLKSSIEPDLIQVDSESTTPFLGSPSIFVNGIDLYTREEPTIHSYSCRTFDVNGTRTAILPVEFIRDRLIELLE